MSISKRNNKSSQKQDQYSCLSKLQDPQSFKFTLIHQVHAQTPEDKIKLIGQKKINTSIEGFGLPQTF